MIIVKFKSIANIPFIAVLWLIAVSFFSCIPLGDKTYEELEPSALPESPTYESHVKDIMDQKCVLCHSSESGRKAEDLSFDNYSDCIPRKGGNKGWKGIEETGIEEKTMPPGSKERFTPREIAILLRWKEQGFVKE